MESLKELLKRRRKEKKLTLSKLASLTGISNVSLCHYETGRSIPNAVTLARLCQVLDLDFFETYAVLEKEKKERGN